MFVRDNVGQCADVSAQPHLNLGPPCNNIGRSPWVLSPSLEMNVSLVPLSDTISNLMGFCTADN